MDERETKLHDHRFEELAPGGFFIAFRVSFLRPEFEYNSLPRAWVLKYTHEGLLMHDPVMRWIYGNAGSKRWSETGLVDELGILAQASEYGLNFGLAVSIVDPDDPGIRSFGNFCRGDREFSQSEADALVERLEEFFGELTVPLDVTEAEVEALRLLKNGLLIKEVAYELGISEGAVKQRLRSAKDKLNARTTPHAVSVASNFGLI